MSKILFSLPLLLAIFLFSCKNKESGEKLKGEMEAVSQTETVVTQTKTDTLVTEQQEVEQEPFQVVESGDGNYTLQVSSWRTRTYAERDAQRFINQGYEAYVQKVDLAGRNETWFRVRIGRFTTMQRGAQFAAKLSELLESGYWLDSYQAEK